MEWKGKLDAFFPNCPTFPSQKNKTHKHTISGQPQKPSHNKISKLSIKEHKIKHIEIYNKSPAFEQKKIKKLKHGAMSASCIMPGKRNENKIYLIFYYYNINIILISRNTQFL